MYGIAIRKIPLERSSFSSGRPNENDGTEYKLTKYTNAAIKDRIMRVFITFSRGTSSFINTKKLK